VDAINTAVKSLVNIIYPLRCASCGRLLGTADESGACRPCEERIKTNPRPYCRSCGRSIDDVHGLCGECRVSPFYFSRAYSACLYEGTMKEMIHAFKYRNNRRLSALFTRLMDDFVKANREITDSINTITFVPLHNKKRRERGFNQSEVLAGALSKICGIPVCGCMVKKAHTKNQNELNRDQRLVNVSGAFGVKDGHDGLLKGRYVLLVDDVMTTGATLNECSRALKEAGASEVRCLTLARGI
jgi:ComF family protein